MSRTSYDWVSNPNGNCSDTYETAVALWLRNWQRNFTLTLAESHDGMFKAWIFLYTRCRTLMPVYRRSDIPSCARLFIPYELGSKFPDTWKIKFYGWQILSSARGRGSMPRRHHHTIGLATVDLVELNKLQHVYGWQASTSRS
jgi:hypothetical protein